MFELSKQFHFDAAHTLERLIDTESSRRIHGHSYRAEVTVRGRPDPVTGMVVDLGMLERMMAEARDSLDHRFLDEINDLGDVFEVVSEASDLVAVRTAVTDAGIEELQKALPKCNISR